MCHKDEKTKNSYVSAIFAYFMTFTDSGILVSYKMMCYSVILYDYWDRDV
jgi:hypothetical protein